MTGEPRRMTLTMGSLQSSHFSSVGWTKAPPGLGKVTVQSGYPEQPMNSLPLRERTMRRSLPHLGHSPMKRCSCRAFLISSPISLRCLVMTVMMSSSMSWDSLTTSIKVDPPLAISSMSFSSWAVIRLSVTILACFSKAFTTAMPAERRDQVVAVHVLPVVELLDDVMPGGLGAQSEFLHLLQQGTLGVTRLAAWSPCARIRPP